MAANVQLRSEIDAGRVACSVAEAAAAEADKATLEQRDANSELQRKFDDVQETHRQKVEELRADKARDVVSTLSVSMPATVLTREHLRLSDRPPRTLSWLCAPTA